MAKDQIDAEFRKCWQRMLKAVRMPYKTKEQSQAKRSEIAWICTEMRRLANMRPDEDEHDGMHEMPPKPARV